MTGNLTSAIDMLDAFASVGVRAFDITHLDLDDRKRGFRPARTLHQAKTSMPYLVESSHKRQNSVIIRPHSPPGVLLVQLDDLDAVALARAAPAAFLTLCTSPGNHQAWLAVTLPEGFDSDDFARRLRLGSGADRHASGASRIAGTKTYKRKYEPDFPMVAIHSAQPGRRVTPAELEVMGLAASPEPVREALPFPLRTRMRGNRPWPSYQRCLAGASPAHGDEKRPDISRADFQWCLLAIDRGHPPDETARRLMEESAKARAQGERYATRTASRAAAAVERRSSVKAR